mgnify:FL=1
MRMRRRSRGLNPGAVLLAAALIVAVVLIFTKQVRPVMESVAVNEAKIKAVNVINEAVLKEIETDPESSRDLILVNRGSDGNVLSITTDAAKVNRLKAKLVTVVQESLNGGMACEEVIPLGTLLGGDLFYGRGPGVTLKLTLSGNISADLKGSFESAGYNQTRHRMMLDISASVYTFLPGMRATADVKTNVLVAETVIVGTVPAVVAQQK